MVSMLLRELAASTPLPVVVISILRPVCKKIKNKTNYIKGCRYFLLKC